MAYERYRRAMELGVQARTLLRNIASLRNLPEELDEFDPYGPVVWNAVSHGLDTSQLEGALRQFEGAMYAALPDIRGEHDGQLYAQGDGGYVRFHGNDAQEIYVELKKFAQ